jgi:hypothetical protein
MLDVEVIEDPAAATVALEPIRSRMLAELTRPAARQYARHSQSEEWTDAGPAFRPAQVRFFTSWLYVVAMLLRPRSSFRQ